MSLLHGNLPDANQCRRTKSCRGRGDIRVKEALGVKDVGCSGGVAQGELSVTNIFPRTNHRLWLSVKHSVPSWNSLKIVF